MDHSTAIMEDAGHAIDNAAAAAPPAADTPAAATPVSATPAEATPTTEDNAAGQPEGSSEQKPDARDVRDNQRKRKREYPDSSTRFGGKGGGRKRDGDNQRHSKGDMGRADYFRNDPDKRAKIADSSQRRQDGEEPSYVTKFTEEEIAAEERKPKRKVAVMIGYSGTGFKGMQISPTEETIEGELFKAFVKAGAIAKTNADDPKKASLVRCARTDKGVHAAGNMISLKLIVEDKDIVEKINENLHPQIRVWGIERTIGSFSCYQACDSRWYEYLIPTQAFLPPHPSSFMAKNLERLADEMGDREGFESRQTEVRDFWQKVEDEQIKPVLDSIDEDIRFDVIKALQGEEEAGAKVANPEGDAEQAKEEGKQEVKEEKAEEAAIVINEPSAPGAEEKITGTEDVPATTADAAAPQKATEASTEQATGIDKERQDRVQRLRAATKRIRAAYNTAKRRYRVPQERIDRVQHALNNYLGTKNYHNYTIQKTFRDPSAKRNIKSFVVNREPVLIGEGPEEEKTEWLSLKVHGQSFMMHQIRKMIGMVTLLVRSGSDIDKTMTHSFSDARFSIPKVPGLGLMLERPVFDSYNNIQAAKHEREPLVFDKYNDKIEEFKRREIYARMFSEEEEKGEFGRFFNHVDNFREPYFLWVSSKGLDATEGWGRKEGYGEIKGGAESD
ncbi:hypothetical protein Q7P37_007742 [Cladosporium fusiforme]